MRFAGFIKTTLLDWDGMVACTVYLPGCNFRCPFCHNKDMVLHPEDNQLIEESTILDFVEENSDFLDGVVISGGEPTLNPELHRFIKELRSRGMMIKLDTNGSRPDVLEDLLGAGLLDYVAMDVKASLDDRYSMATGVNVDLQALRDSIRLIIDSGVDHEFRTTVVPHIVREEDVDSITESVRGARRYSLQQFRPKVTLDENLSVLDPYPESKILEMARRAKPRVQKVQIKGL
ncbi:MAG: anaerobic ribonucleoside-triphosphate reductase activating protein [Candidatus Methanomethylophilaceae archaeon]